MTEHLSWLHAALLLLPLVLIALSYVPLFLAHLRSGVLVLAVLTVVVATTLFVLGRAEPGLMVVPPWDNGRGSGATLLRVDQLALPLFPMATLIWAAGLLVAPAASYSSARVRRSALSCASLLIGFSTTSIAVLGVVWLASSLTFVLEQRHQRRVARVVAIYLTLSSITFVAGATVLATGHDVVGASLLCIAVLVRKGIVPLHSWMPESFEHGHLVPTIAFTTPQLGTYVMAVVLLPRAPAAVLTAVAIAALITALYGALLGLVEADARRAVGYLFMSQSALVLAGIDSATAAGVGGSLAVWLSSAIASAGLGLTLASLEARRGRLSLRRHHGGVERMPLLAASFVVMGLATVGFPATLGFVGHDQLVSGSVERFPFLGFVLVGATAVNGITALRMYFSLFCGHRQAPVPLALRRRELTAFAVLAAVLVAAGVFPNEIVASRTAAATRLLQARRPATDLRGEP